MFETRADAGTAIGELEVLMARLQSERQEYDFKLPALVSHVDDYISDPARLARYAREVITGRIMQFMAVSFMKTQLFLDIYLSGYKSRNPYSLLMAARTSLEAYATVWDTFEVVKSNAGVNKEGFANRVKAIDLALINALYGTRSGIITDLFPQLKASRLREVKPSDVEAIKAKNVMTRIERLSKKGPYSEAYDDYERLSEYLHPNMGQNIILTWPSPINRKLMRACTRSEEALFSATCASFRPMEKSARGIRTVFQEATPPFGLGRIVPLSDFK